MADETSPGVCQFVGDPKPDIAGVGILAGFAGQGLLSLILALWVFFFSRHGRLDMLHEDGYDEHEIEVKRLEMVRDILMIGNDIQLMMGVALMITSFASYHAIANQGLLGVTASEAADASEAATRLHIRSESSADEETTENEWDFGQTTAILLLFVALVKAFGKGYEFCKFERQLKKEQKSCPGLRPASRGSSGIESDDLQQQQQHGDGRERDQAERDGREENVPLNTNNWKSSPREQITHVDTVSSVASHSTSRGTGSAINMGVPYDVESNAQPQHLSQHLPQNMPQTLTENQHLYRRQ